MMFGNKSVKISVGCLLMAAALSLCADQMPDSKHVFSMSCKVTACNGDLASREGRAKAVSWWKKNGFSKLWLESYRHGEQVPVERLVEERDAFRAEGFEVCGMITPTMLNDTEPGKKEPRMVVCWSDPKARERIGGRISRREAPQRRGAWCAKQSSAELTE